ncbi:MULTISPECIES: AAA family ATPase [unclassified Helicobacter]|uniref:AAA family ATPase n=1 Tax=unclassified Helicobacter TaxID=2593540 RepID=UPI000CF19B82|nr:MULTISPECIES: ATP-dependent metallopeptidase FtsH/Yme1/Tma family protein [unclassified Helicobacter]
MQRFKNSLYISIISCFILGILTIILFTRDYTTPINTKELENIINQNKTIKKVLTDETFLYFYIDKECYKIPKFAVDNELIKNLKIQEKQNYSSLFFIVLFIALILGFLLFYRRYKKPQKEVGKIETIREEKSQNNIYTPMTSKVSFDDIAGIEEVKEELLELIDFLKNPSRYQKLDIVMPKGVLLSGPPGIGKTMIAKAMANEAGVPFFYHSGSSFVQIYAGMGAKRVRDLFSSAKKNAPSIIFIDEIDSVGKARDKNRSDEREATLNELLTQMDGFDENSGIIVIGATNKINVLDEALLRSGRFDRKLLLELPSIEDRVKILKKHLKNKKIDFDLHEVAKLCVGFSGAALATLVNESALYALKHKKEKITMEDVLALKDKVFLGKRLPVKLDSYQKELLSIYQASKCISAVIFGLEFEKCSLVLDFFIQNENGVLSQSLLEKQARFYLSGICGLKLIKKETFTIGQLDLQEIEKILQKMYEFYMIKDTKLVFKDLKEQQLDFLEKYIEEISIISKRLLEEEVLTFDTIKQSIL